MSTKKYFNIAKNKLFPICRSITGKGLRETLYIIKKEFPEFKIKSIGSGKKVFDWIVPKEWNITEGFILDDKGEEIVNFKKNNLHVVGYSAPVDLRISRDSLLRHIYSLKKQPNAIPYVTSYYKKRWGFCISYNHKLKILKTYKAQDYFNVVIKSTFSPKGKMDYGEFLIKGKSSKEILISTYVCHPSMANNELSGPIVSMSLMSHFLKITNLNKSLRFIFIPETIGSIAYIQKNLKKLQKNVIGGYNLTCIGDNKNHSCMFTKYKNTIADESLIESYKKLKISFKEYSFLERGSDERQFNSPGVDLSIASIFRTKYWEYPEYHTSLDNFDLVSHEGIKGGFEVAKKAIEILIKKKIPKAVLLCEPQMSKRKLYPTLSIKNKKNKFSDYMNFLQYSDGKNSLEKISVLSKISYKKGYSIYKELIKKKLINE